MKHFTTPSRRILTGLVAIALLTLAGGMLAISAAAADQAILGRGLLVKDPVVDDATRRKLIASARESDSPDVIEGDPTLQGGGGGALLSIDLRGDTPSRQSFPLPQGLSSRGKPFWEATRTDGFRYRDPKGENGPVRSLVVRKNRNAFLLKATILGRNGPVELAPPNLGNEAFLTLQLTGGDRLCVQFGAESTATRNDAQVWRLAKVVDEGCPSGESGELLALAYNVAGLPDILSGSNPAVNTELISPLLNAYDLVLVQESWQTPDPNPLAPLRLYHEILAADALHPFQSVSAPIPLGNDPRRPSAQLSDGLNRFSRFPFEDVLREAWEDCDNSSADCLALKGFSMARTTLAPGVSVDVYNLHMEAGGTENDEQLREDGVTQMVEFINTHSVGRAILFGGDFNLHTDEEPDSTTFNRLLSEGGLTDVCAALACPEPGRIDKMLFRSNAQITITPLSWNFETDVFIRDDLEPLSDHDPLAVRFRWTRTP